jgi:hypothetical protein
VLLYRDRRPARLDTVKSDKKEGFRVCRGLWAQLHHRRPRTVEKFGFGNDEYLYSKKWTRLH